MNKTVRTILMSNDRRRRSDDRYRTDNRYDYRMDGRGGRYDVGGYMDDRYRMDDRYGMDDRYMDDRYDGGGEMRMIGFRDHQRPYVGDSIRGSEKMMGHASIDHSMAEKWVEQMQNADGTTGAHWTMEQIKRIMQQKNIDENPVEFWAAMNATYSDLCKVASKHGIDNIDFYIDLATAFWLKDKDAVKNKLAMYYEYVVKH